jgi:hypothetical protein
MIAPIGFMVVRASHTLGDWTRDIGIGLAVIAVCSIVVGVLFMIPALLRQWAYRKIGGAEPD